MRQVLQNLKNGDVELAEVPCPRLKAGHLLIRTTRTLISAGTERMLLDFGKANYLNKARQQPEKVKQVLHKIQTDGLVATVNAVRTKLDQPMAMGYCNVGVVIGVGHGVHGYKVGNRVVSNGNHAEVVVVPKNLCAPVPEGVADEDAAFTVLGSIALQGVRLAAPTLGESFAVFGLGLVGLLTVQLLRVSGARVIGFDFDEQRVALAKTYGAEAICIAGGADPIQAGVAFSRQSGVDGVVVTAATSSDELMHQAAQMCRKRGRIILTGVTGLHLQRADFYEKEITFQVSCSYGPGRYDPSYEEQGRDYPLGFVRWTEQRNFGAVLDLMAEQRLQMGALISKRVSFDAVEQAYAALREREAIGILLEYPQPQNDEQVAALLGQTVSVHAAVGRNQPDVLAVIGAGAFTYNMVLPKLSGCGGRLKWICSSKGQSGTIAARKYGIENSTTDMEAILADDEVKALVVTTRHNTHARFVLEGLRRGKHVFVEKPLCLTAAELADIEATMAAFSTGEAPILMVGYNRRFAPLVQPIHKFLAQRTAPLSMTFTCNAGMLPTDNWNHDPEIGGGRILGEACHFIDLLQFLVGAPVTHVGAMKQQRESGDTEDNVVLSLMFADGSIGNINYFSGGHKSFPKERLEVFTGGGVICLNNFRELRGYGIRGFSNRKSGLDKGHEAEFQAFVAAIRGETEAPIPFSQLVNTTHASLAALTAMRNCCVVDLTANPADVVENEVS
ncbi:bi-domain-containing oxidoreductase [Acanthopleuribacter pedis]|uniref:Bi-domain-containing oxidoreductase n=1 Tax=Acanthopleuribacter pedis TaxID=442870 RepID=A0A8J7Q8F6_9BACT|nr:bi-domain-containing oxidoreductase [Acanthopleuribacter pedis]MBO1320401.1 bi-domain-containing oxidoreductase [Acanthopleuribacter pedis]